MGRNAGQIRAREAVGGAVALALVVAVVVAAAGALLPPPDPRSIPEDRAAGESAPCPVARESVARVAPPVATEPIAVTSTELLECPSLFDGQPVVYEGEVVRAVLRRGDRAWVQLNDDPYGVEIGPLPRHLTTAGANSGMAVSIPAADAARIDHVGNARAWGDRVRAVGVFLRADPADAGGPAIQAHTVEITAVGETVDPRVTPARLVVALLLAAAAVAMIRTVRRSDSR